LVVVIGCVYVCGGCEELGELVFQTEQRQGEGKRWVSAHRSTGGQGMAAAGEGGLHGRLGAREGWVS